MNELGAACSPRLVPTRLRGSAGVMATAVWTACGGLRVNETHA